MKHAGKKVLGILLVLAILLGMTAAAAAEDLPASVTVTFKVVHGRWDDDGTNQDRIVILTGDLKLSIFDIPYVGRSPDEGYEMGDWEPEINLYEPITKDTVYTYIYDVAKARPDISGAVITVEDQVYTGKEIEPIPTVTLDGEELLPGVDFVVKEFIDNIEIGKGKIKIVGFGDYDGMATVTFKIIPKKVTLSKLKAGENTLTVQWKKGKSIDGYEIEYSLKKNFKNAKTMKVSKAKTTSAKLKKLKSGKTYYVRIRAYKEVKGKKYYSRWSKVLSKKVK